MSDLKERAATLKSLAKGWDGYNADPPVPSVIDRALRFAECLHRIGAPLVQITPCSDGTVMVHTNGEEDATFDFFPCFENKTAARIEQLEAELASYRTGQLVPLPEVEELAKAADHTATRKGWKGKPLDKQMVENLTIAIINHMKGKGQPHD